MGFYDTFVGEFVELTTHKEIQAIEDEIMVVSPIMLRGYLVDMDDEYFYLGEDPQKVSDAVERSTVWRIMILDPEAIIRDALKNMPIPTEQNEIN